MKDVTLLQPVFNNDLVINPAVLNECFTIFLEALKEAPVFNIKIGEKRAALLRSAYALTHTVTSVTEPALKGVRPSFKKECNFFLRYL